MKALVLLVLPLLAQYWEDSPVVTALKKDVAAITDQTNEGRAPGSRGEQAVASYVWDRMSGAGLEMISPRGGDVFGIFRKENGDTLISRNVAGFIQGYDPALRDRYIIVGAHIDNIGASAMTVDGRERTAVFPGANSNASGVAAMLSLCRRCVAAGPLWRRSILFVGFGSGSAGFAGSWHFLHNSFASDASRIDAFINLDSMGCSARALRCFTCGNADIESIIAALSGQPQAVKVEISTVETYPSDHQVFYAASVPSVTFSGSRFPEHNTVRDTPDRVDFDFIERSCEYVFNFLSALCDAPAGMPAFHGKTDGKADESSGGDVRSWSDCEVRPSFLGNSNPSFFLQKWVYQYLKYPQDCVREGVQGRVMVSFTIGDNGAVRDVSVQRGVDPRLDEAAVKVVAASPKWTPARIKGSKVACRITIPVEFRLKKKK